MGEEGEGKKGEEAVGDETVEHTRVFLEKEGKEWHGMKRVCKEEEEKKEEEGEGDTLALS